MVSGKKFIRCKSNWNVCKSNIAFSLLFFCDLKIIKKDSRKCSEIKIKNYLYSRHISFFIIKNDITTQKPFKLQKIKHAILILHIITIICTAYYNVQKSYSGFSTII